MKKITLLCFMILAGYGYAQTSVFLDDFEDDTYPGWAFYDDDGDGFNWGEINQIPDGDGGFVTPPSLISRSWQQVPLTPDNWAVSPAIDLSNASGSIDLEYITQVASAFWDEEKYSLYISTTDDIDAIKSLDADLTETLGDAGDTGTPETHNFDLTSYAGETIYVVFRHWDTTDMDYLAIDSVEVIAENLSISDFEAFNFNYFVDSQNHLNLSANQAFEQIQLHNLLGQLVLSQKLSAQNERIDLNSLSKGVYLVQAQINNVSKTFKVFKK